MEASGANILSGVYVPVSCVIMTLDYWIFKKFSQPAVNNFSMVYFNPATYSWKEILGPVLWKTRSWGWETVFDLVPFCWGRGK